MLHSQVQSLWEDSVTTNELHHEKTCFGGFQPGLTKARLYGHRRLLDSLKISDLESRGIEQYMVQISCTVTVKLICTIYCSIPLLSKSEIFKDSSHLLLPYSLGFAICIYAKSRFSHNAAKI